MRRRVAIVLLVVAGALTACGGGGSDAQRITIDATPAAMRKAVDATAAKGSSRVDLTMAMQVNGQTATMTATGAVDSANKRGDLTFDMKDLVRAAAAGKSLPPERAAMFDQPIEMLLDGTVMYMHFPALAQLQGGDKQWIKIDLAAANSDVGALLGGGAGPGSDPSSMLQFLQGAGTVTEVGKEDVRGTATTHFTGTYTIQGALDALPDDRRDTLNRAFTSLGLPDSAKTEEIPYDVWVSDDGLVRKMAFTLDMTKLMPASAAPTGVGQMSFTMEFYDFGTPVNFDVPPDDQVLDASSMLQSSSK